MIIIIVSVLLTYIDHIFSRTVSIMLAFCVMPLSYYAQNYAGIIARLIPIVEINEGTSE